MSDAETKELDAWLATAAPVVKCAVPRCPSDATETVSDHDDALKPVCHLHAVSFYKEKAARACRVAVRGLKCGRPGVWYDHRFGTWVCENHH
jgi:hypothetical protein